MPAPAPFPNVPLTQLPDTILMQDPATFPEVKMDFPIANGPFQPTWPSIDANHPGDPAWLREAKFGIWVHFGPQAAGESGDWYARRMYQPGTLAYQNHLRKYGPPSISGYKELLHTWNPAKLDPVKLVKTYQDAGARFLLIQGVHHDNFDNWDSTYQPWNSVNMGPHRDLLGEWSKAVRAAGLHFGVAFHHEYSWWWYPAGVRQRPQRHARGCSLRCLIRRSRTESGSGGKGMTRACCTASICEPTEVLPMCSIGLKKASSRIIWDTRTGTRPAGRCASWM